MTTEQKSKFTELLVNAVTAAVIPALVTFSTLSYKLGESNTDIKTIAQTQQVQSQQLDDMTDRVTTIDKSQAVLASDVKYLNSEISRLNQGWTSLSEDMKCLRAMTTSKGDYKC